MFAHQNARITRVFAKFWRVEFQQACGSASPHALQFLPDSQDVGSRTSNGSGSDRPCLRLGGNYRLARTKCSLIFPCMRYRPPTVKLPMPAEKIEGQTVTFRPVRDGIDSEVSGVMQVIENPNGFNVNVSFIVRRNPPLSRVYWFD